MEIRRQVDTGQAEGNAGVKFQHRISHLLAILGSKTSRFQLQTKFGKEQRLLLVAIEQRDDESVSAGCAVVGQIGTLRSRPLHRRMNGEVLRKRALTDSQNKNQREQNELAAPPKSIHATMHHVLDYLLLSSYFLFLGYLESSVHELFCPSSL